MSGDSMQFKFEIKQSEKDSTVFVVKLGEHVLGGVDAINFRDEVAQFAKTDAAKLLADLSDVELMNSTGLGMLISAYSTLKKAGKDFSLINIPEKVQQLLRLTKLDSVLIQ